MAQDTDALLWNLSLKNMDLSDGAPIREEMITGKKEAQVLAVMG